IYIYYYIRINKAEELVLQDTLQVSLAEQKSHEEDEARENVEKFKKHLIAEEIKKLVEGSENVEENVKDNSSPLRNDDNHTDPDTRLEPRSDKESLEVKVTAIAPPVNVNDGEEESSGDDYESPRFHFNLISSDTEKPQELTENDPTPSSSTPSSSSPKFKLSATNRLLSLFKAKPGRFKRYKNFFQELQGRYGYLFEHLSAKFMPRRKFNELVKNLEDIMMESLARWPFVIHPRDQDDPHDDAHPERDNNDDVIPNEKVSQELVDEISQTIDEAKLRKVVDEMLRQQCTSGDEHHCQRDPKAPGLPQVNQDLLYLKKGNSGPEKIVLSLH
ncbi:hypothetical protein Tco_1441454, partial [Tanacetum coccineum]